MKTPNDYFKLYIWFYCNGPQQLDLVPINFGFGSLKDDCHPLNKNHFRLSRLQLATLKPILA